jgi:hypothetical protein
MLTLQLRRHNNEYGRLQRSNIFLHQPKPDRHIWAFHMDLLFRPFGPSKTGRWVHIRRKEGSTPAVTKDSGRMRHIRRGSCNPVQEMWNEILDGHHQNQNIVQVFDHCLEVPARLCRDIRRQKSGIRCLFEGRVETTFFGNPEASMDPRSQAKFRTYRRGNRTILLKVAPMLATGLWAAVHWSGGKLTA